MAEIGLLLFPAEAAEKIEKSAEKGLTEPKVYGIFCTWLVNTNLCG